MIVVEVLDRRGQVRSRTRLAALPATVGRGFRNDIVLDDRYVDPEHARLVLDETGALAVEDAGSVNGVLPADRPQKVPRLPLASGGEFRLGHTTLRVWDADHPVPAALRDSPPSSVAWGLERPAVALAVIGATVGLFAVNEYLGSTARTGVAKAFSEALLVVLVLAFWAGGWALVSQIAVHRFRFLAHLALACAVAASTRLAFVAEEYLGFIFPDSDGAAAASGLAIAAGIIVLFAGHLALASTLSPKRRWWTAVAVCAAALGLVGLSQIADEGGFSTALEYDARLKPFGARWLRAETPEAFVGETAQLRTDVDGETAEGDETDSTPAPEARAP